MSSDRSSYCEERKALLMAYESATRIYSQAVWELTRAVGSTAYDEYELMKTKVAEARERSEQARERLAEHVRKHNC